MVRHYGELAPITVIRGGVDLERFSPRPRNEARAELGMDTDDKILLFVGRIQRLKGLEVLLRAFARLDDLPVRLVVVGGQPGTSQESREIARLQHLATRLGVDGRTTFVGAFAPQRLPLSSTAAA